MRRKRWLVCVGLILLGWGLMPGTARAQGAEINSLTVAGDPPSSGGSGGQTSGGGDLFIEIQCYGGAWAWHHDDNVSLWMRIYVENQLVAEQYHHGTWYVTGGVHASVRASTQDRSVSCYADGSGILAQASGTILGSGPLSVRVTTGAFIPEEWVDHPGDMDIIFGGDNRGFQEDAATARVAQVTDVYNSAVSDDSYLSGPHNYTGLTTAYDRDTSLTSYWGNLLPAAFHDWVPGYPMKISWAFASTSGFSHEYTRMGPAPWDGTSTVQHISIGSAADPLIAFAPAVDYRMVFQLTFGLNKVQYRLTGCHDGFPAYEAYINGTAVYTRWATGNVFAMFGYCDTDIGVQTGVIQ
jgi:hypothetical protein